MDNRLGFSFDRGMSTPLLLPKLESPALLEGLEVQCLGAPEPIERWNRLVCEHHYLKNADLVGEQLRYVVASGRCRLRDPRERDAAGSRHQQLHLRSTSAERDRARLCGHHRLERVDDPRTRLGRRRECIAFEA